MSNDLPKGYSEEANADITKLRYVCTKKRPFAEWIILKNNWTISEHPSKISTDW